MGIVEELGFAADDRVVVVHVDDVGMSASANRGALEAMAGTATCGSIMVPCPGFEGIASVCRERPELDLGVHLTLNAEYESWRWGAVADDVPGLLSPDGGMWRSTAETVANASPEEVDRELRAQIDRALEAGIDVTHLDSHMGTVFDFKFAAIYFQLGRDYDLPLFVPRVSREMLGPDLAPSLEGYLRMIDEAEAEGLPVFDQFNADSLSFAPGSGLEHNSRRVRDLAPGLSYLITHCAEGGSELESIAPDWRQRAEEHRIYSDGSMQGVFDGNGIHRVGMRELRDLIRG